MMDITLVCLWVAVCIIIMFIGQCYRSNCKRAHLEKRLKTVHESLTEQTKNTQEANKSLKEEQALVLELKQKAKGDELEIDTLIEEKEFLVKNRDEREKKLKKDVAEMTGDRDRCLEEIDSLNEESKSQAKFANEQTEKVSKLEVENRDYRKDIEALKNNVAKMQKERNIAVDERDKLQDTLNSTKTDLAHYTKEVERLSKSVNGLKELDKVSKRKINEAWQAHTAMIHDRNKYKKSFEDLEKKVKASRGKVKDVSYKKKYIEYQRKYASKCSEVSRLKERLEKLNKEA